MMRTVNVKDIKSNPFQARTSSPQETIDQLAEEIKTTGLWTGALRGRAVNGHIELCFGHRRLAAIKKLGWKTVDIDVMELDDPQMAAQSLIENLQREGLNDADKADGIRQLVDLLGGSDEKSRATPIKRQVAELLGFSDSRITEWLQLSELKDKEKNLIRKGKISGKSALHAARLGGAAMIRVAAAKGLSQHHIERLNRQLINIPDQNIRAKVTESVIAGDAITPEKIQEKIRNLEAKTKKDAPPDLIVVITQWTQFIDKWTKQLDEVRPYVEYIDKVPSIANKFRAAVRALITALEAFV